MLRVTQDDLGDANSIHGAHGLAEQGVSVTTRSAQATGRPSRSHTRSNLTGDRSAACSMRNRGR